MALESTFSVSTFKRLSFLAVVVQVLDKRTSALSNVVVA